MLQLDSAKKHTLNGGMNSKNLLALDLLLMGDMDLRNWFKRVSRESHASMMIHKYIKIRAKENGKVFYVAITRKGKLKLKQK